MWQRLPMWLPPMLAKLFGTINRSMAILPGSVWALDTPTTAWSHPHKPRRPSSPALRLGSKVSIFYSLSSLTLCSRNYDQAVGCSCLHGQQYQPCHFRLLSHCWQCWASLGVEWWWDGGWSWLWRIFQDPPHWQIKAFLFFLFPFSYPRKGSCQEEGKKQLICMAVFCFFVYIYFCFGANKCSWH